MSSTLIGTAMKIFFRENKILAISAALTGFFFLLSLILAIFNFGDFSPPLILHFDQYRGADLLGGPAAFWLILAGALILILLNFFLAKILWEREKFLAYFLFLANLLLSVILLVAVSVIVNTN